MKERDNLILCAVGRQQVGKTTQTRKELLFQYVSGKKALIFTPQLDRKLEGYHSQEILQCAKELEEVGGKVGIDLARYKKYDTTWPVKRIAYDPFEEDTYRRVAGIMQLAKSKGAGIRMVTPLLNYNECVKRGGSPRYMSTKQKRRAAKDILEHFDPLAYSGRRNGIILLDDINRYVIRMHTDEDFTGVLVNVNHRGCDIIVQYHDLMQVPPQIYRFGNRIRLHKTANKAQKSDKYNYQLLSLAECIVDEECKYNFRFFLYVDGEFCKITGATERQFRAGAKRYLKANPAVASGYGSFDNCIAQYLMPEYFQGAREKIAKNSPKAKKKRTARRK